MVVIFIGIIFLHWLGDFCLQTRWMADNKSKDWEALTLHVFIYSLTLFFGLAITRLYSVNDLCQFTIVNFAIHWCVDTFTSRYTKKSLEKNNMHLFFAIIGFDQFLHITTLLLTAESILRRTQ